MRALTISAFLLLALAGTAAASAITTAPAAYVCAYDTGKPCPGENATRDAMAKDEIWVREDIRDQAAKAVKAHDFAALNAMAREFRANRSRTPSGIWKLEEFYAGVSVALNRAFLSESCAYWAKPFLEAWIAADPNSPTAYIAQADLLSDRGWCFRGSDFAGSVAQDAWPLFHKYLGEARETLERHRKFASVDPEWYVAMQKIYKGEGVDEPEYRRLLEEATAREPYYYSIYFEAALYYLPQWNGSYAQIDQLARYAAQKTAAEEGAGAYARVYWYLIGCGCGGPELEIDRSLLEKSMSDVLAHYPNDWNTANFAMIACGLGDGRATARYMAKLPPRYGAGWRDPKQWHGCERVAGLG